MTRCIIVRSDELSTENVLISENVSMVKYTLLIYIIIVNGNIHIHSVGYIDTI